MRSLIYAWIKLFRSNPRKEGSSATGITDISMNYSQKAGWRAALKLSQRRRSSPIAFRDLVDPASAKDSGSREIYERIQRESGKIPEIYRVRAFAENSRWLKVLDSSVFRWPQSCSISDKTRELVGLAKSIAYLWEPGVLTNIEGALEAGATSDEVLETIALASIVTGLADLDRVLHAVPPDFTLTAEAAVSSEKETGDRGLSGDQENALHDFAALHGLKPLMANQDWLSGIHQSAKTVYERGALDLKTAALVCLAASAGKCWDKGIQEHIGRAVRSGATEGEVVDVVASVYKTRVSIGVQMGFSVPCSIPSTSGFKVLNDYYSQRKGRTRRSVRGR
jgi:alkylhydroperoxidase/carboxymuconolactone decarboxylase family protein YurZ